MENFIARQSKKDALLVGYARVSKADDQDTARPGKSPGPGRLQANLRGEGLWWPMGPASTPQSLSGPNGHAMFGSFAEFKSFSRDEAESIFRIYLKNETVENHRDALLEFAERMERLPIAIVVGADITAARA